VGSTRDLGMRHVTRGKYYIDKICTNMGGSKNVKELNGKKKSIKRPKFKILVV
jgi:hypothetical protein